MFKKKKKMKQMEPDSTWKEYELKKHLGPFGKYLFHILKAVKYIGLMRTPTADD